MKTPLDATYVVERSIHQLVKFLFLSFILALALTHTSKSLWLNVPLALAAVAGLYWLSLQVEIRARSNGTSAFYRRGRKESEEFGSEGATYTASVPPPASNKSDTKWREQVGSPVVEHAWETLCGSIIQEFVYDTWYAVLTPDREFPREIRRILNTAFGELAGRARRADVRKMLLGDVSALFMEQIMLYRDTRDSILAGLDHDAWRVMPLEARERALQAEMKADCNLHPALYPPSPDGSATLGHYKVMRHISEGLVAFMLERHDHAKPILRSVARELLSSCVLRCLMFFFNPYTANKLILSLLREKVERKPLGVEELAAAAVAASSAEPLTKAQQDIEQRARQSAAAEDSHAASVRAAKQAQRERGAAALQRSRSEAVPSPRGPSPSRKDRRNWSPGKRDKFKAPPSPMQPHKAQSEAASAAPQQRSNEGATASSSVRDGSDGSDDWEDVYQVRRAANPGGSRHGRSVSMSHADSPSPAYGQEAEGDWLGPGDMGRREANGTAGAAVFADSNFTPDPDIPEGPQAPGTERYCFIGQPLARVVAAELCTEGSKDVVLYKIRVADASGEWTVSRRFRNFETLHRALRESAAYRLRLPAKRIFSQQHSVEFVEDRRQQLDAYLQALLANPVVAGCKEVWEFLSRWSELYALDSEGGFLRSVSAKIQGANTTMRRAVGDMVEEMDMTRRKSMARLRNRGDAPDVSLDGQPMHRASRSFSRDLGKLRHLGGGRKANGGGQDVVTQPPPFQAMHAPGSAGSSGTGSGSVRMLRISGPSDLINGAGQLLAAGARQVQGVKQVLQGAEDRPEPRHFPTSALMPAPSFSVDDIPVEEFHGELLHYSRPASLQSQANSPTETPLSATPASSRGHSPTRQAAEQQRGGPAGGTQVQRRTEATPPHTEQLHHSSSAQDLASTAKVTRFRQESMQKANSLEAPDTSEQQADEAALSRSAPSTGGTPQPPQPGEPPPPKPRGPPQRGDTGHISFGGIVQSPSVASVAANIEAVGPPSGLRVPDLMRDDPDMADWEEAAGISAPLYDIVDTLFELQSRGFFRRQVFGVARQVLSLVAGGAIDEWLLSNMRALRQEHTLARLLCHLQRQLWPGGAWFQSLPENQHPAGKPAQRWVMTAENFLAAHGDPPIDEDEIREAVWELLFARAPPALVRVVGKQVYHSGMADLFEMMQSRTFMQQLGYGLLKIGLVNLFPELKLLFRKIERGALDATAGPPGPPITTATANSGSEPSHAAAPAASSKPPKH